MYLKLRMIALENKMYISENCRPNCNLNLTFIQRRRRKKLTSRPKPMKSPSNNTDLRRLRNWERDTYKTVCFKIMCCAFEDFSFLPLSVLTFGNFIWSRLGIWNETLCLKRNYTIWPNWEQAKYLWHFLAKFVAAFAKKNNCIASVICPRGFTYLPSAGSCYKVVFERYNWTSAGKKCQEFGRGSQLVAIQSVAENNAVIKFLTSELLVRMSNIVQI